MALPHIPFTGAIKQREGREDEEIAAPDGDRKDDILPHTNTVRSYSTTLISLFSTVLLTAFFFLSPREHKTFGRGGRGTSRGGERTGRKGRGSWEDHRENGKEIGISWFENEQ